MLIINVKIKIAQLAKLAEPLCAEHIYNWPFTSLSEIWWIGNSNTCERDATQIKKNLPDLSDLMHEDVL